MHQICYDQAKQRKALNIAWSTWGRKLLLESLITKNNEGIHIQSTAYRNPTRSAAPCQKIDEQYRCLNFSIISSQSLLFLSKKRREATCFLVTCSSAIFSFHICYHFTKPFSILSLLCHSYQSIDLCGVMTYPTWGGIKRWQKVHSRLRTYS